MDYVGAAGRSGGLTCLWDPSVFMSLGVLKHRHFVVIRGRLVGCNKTLNIINVYAPHRVSDKKVVWDSILEVMGSVNDMWVLLGDFNAVRFPEERKNSVFNSSCASAFNGFIDSAELVEYYMRDRRFTFIAPNSNKLSKIDRVFVSREFFNTWPNACLRALPRLFSDHCPLLLVVDSKNFGAIPFRFFNSWFEKEGLVNVVENAVESFENVGCRPDVKLTNKFKHIRDKIKEWRKVTGPREKEDFNRNKEEMDRIDMYGEIRDLTEEEVWIKAECFKNICELVRQENMDLKQRSRCRWAVDEDENSAFFHRLINNRKLF
ncbi:uncharacterized protein LOC110944915 [Helianthus annuus]|uniref:uncharacterized protein LOC110944915 n=1 Tax=Helianthus annuus TaxID=4232 RepID=UPI000B903C36|nr:uncharacterized protein LOC110944915 [Helianthus annuus]